MTDTTPSALIERLIEHARDAEWCREDLLAAAEALRTQEAKVDFTACALGREKDICDSLTAENEQLEQRLSTEIVVRNALREENQALTKQLDDAACAGEGHLREIQVLTAENERLKKLLLAATEEGA